MRNPLLPPIFKVSNISRRILARWVVVELNPNIVKKACFEGITNPSIWERTLRSST